jgi:hypothetical protein
VAANTAKPLSSQKIIEAMDLLREAMNEQIVITASAG